MWLLTFAAMVEGLAVFGEVSTTQAVETSIVRLQQRKLLIIRKRLEFCTHVQWVLLTLAQDTVLTTSICGAHK